MYIYLVKLKNRILITSQRLGKALMLPVAVLPAAAILMGIGYWLDPTGFGSKTPETQILVTVGMTILSNIPILFAVGVAIGMAKEKDASVAMAGLLAYLIFIRMLSPESVAMYNGISINEVEPAFYNIGNQFTGIISGLVAAKMYNKFSEVRFPGGLDFFSGKRFVPIISSLVMFFVSALFYFIWPLLYNNLIIFGTKISSMGAIGSGIYGFLNRLLIPLGLHHPLNSVFWFDVIGISDVEHFWASKGVLGKTGMYLAGYFPIMMFGLPGAALAISRSAHPGKKKKTKSLMMTSAFASFFTGITEPLEFSFMFAAPGLYLLHAIYTGISMYIAARFQWIAGFAFSAGLTDFLLSLRMPMSKDILMLIPLGIGFFFLYYFSFTFFIKKYDILTPGREKRRTSSIEMDTTLYTRNYKRLSKSFLKACGGKENIISLDACITRLRLEVRDPKEVNEKTIKAIGAAGVLRHDNSIQIIIGPQVAYILDEMKAMLDGTEEKKVQKLKSER